MALAPYGRFGRGRGGSSAPSGSLTLMRRRALVPWSWIAAAGVLFSAAFLLARREASGPERVDPPRGELALATSPDVASPNVPLTQAASTALDATHDPELEVVRPPTVEASIDAVVSDSAVEPRRVPEDARRAREPASPEPTRSEPERIPASPQPELDETGVEVEVEVEVRLLAADGAPLAGWSCWLEDDAQCDATELPTGSPSARTDAEGRASVRLELRGGAAGTVLLRAWAPGGRDAVVARVAPTSGEPHLVVARGERWREVSGRVVALEDGTPLGGSRVTLLAPAGGSETAVGRADSAVPCSVLESVVADAEGRFALNSAPRFGAWLAVSGDRVFDQPRMAAVAAGRAGAIEDDGGLEGLVLRARARCDLRISLGGAALGVRGLEVVVQDARGEVLHRIGASGGGTPSSAEAAAVGDLDLPVSCAARRVSLLADGRELASRAIAPRPGGRIDVRF